MAVAVGSTSTLALGNRTNSTVTAPSSIANGDLLLAFVSAGDGNDTTAPTVTGPAGFTKVTGSPFSISKADPYATGINVFWKIAASESGNYTFTHGAADSQALMYRITGANTTTPLSPTMTSATGTGKTATATGLTTATNDSLVIYGAILWDGGPGTQPAGTTPTFTERLDTGALYFADGVLATAGATGNKANATAFTAQSVISPYNAILVAVQAAGSGSQSITGALFTDGDTFFGATVAPGAVGISGALFSNANSFFGATVSASYAITGALYTDADTFQAATVSASYTVSGGLFSDGDTFFGATVAPGSVSISGALYTDADSFFASTVSQVGNPQSITGALFSNANTFFGATVSTTYSVSGALYSDADTFFGASVSPGAVIITGGLYSDADSFFGATVTQAGDQTVTGALYANDNRFFGSTVTNGIQGGGGNWAYNWGKPLRKEERQEEQKKLNQAQKQAQKAVAAVIRAPGILSGDLTAIVRQEVESIPQYSWLTPEMINLITTRIEAQFRRAYLRKQQEDDEDDDEAFLLVA